MRIEIFVVRSPKENKITLGFALENLIGLFGGCTVIPNCKGAWIDKNNTIITDKVEIWLICVYNPQHKYRSDAFIKREVKQSLKPILASIKDATQQTCQAYTLNNDIAFV